MTKRVVYFDYQPLSQQVYDDYYLGRLVAAGCCVEYLDLTPLYFPTHSKEVTFEGVVIHKVASFRELEQFIRNHDQTETLYISRLTFSYIVARLFRLFKKYNCKLVALTRGGFPTENKAQKLLNFSLKKYIRYGKQLITLFLKKAGYFKTYDYIFNCGSSLYMIGIGWGEDIKKAVIKPINTVDYERIRDIEKLTVPNLIEEKYVVFLDEYYPFHTDLEICGLKAVPYEEYYNELNRLFKNIEDKFHLEVVIAAHPKAQLYKEKDFFEGRKVIFGKTAELVKYSKFAMVHDSTALGFAIATEKPLLFLNAELIKKSMPDVYQVISFIGQYLNAPIIFFDNREYDIPIPVVDKGRYEEYKYNFLTNKETEELNSGEIFVKEIVNCKI